MKILIKGGRVVDPKNDFDKVADVLVDNGVISEIGENINADGDVTVIFLKMLSKKVGEIM